MFYEVDPSVRRALDEHHRAYLAGEFRAAQTMFNVSRIQAVIQHMPSLFAAKRLQKSYDKSLTQQRQVPT